MYFRTKKRRLSSVFRVPKTHEEINAIVKADVEKINDKLPPYKRIKRVYTTDEPMEKTSTQKVKRFVETQKIIDEEKAEKLRREEAKSEEA